MRLMPKVKTRLYLFLFIGIVVWTVFLVLTPSDIYRLAAGPSEQELGIQRIAVPGPFARTGDTIKVLLPKDFTSEKQYPVLYILPVTSAFLDQWWHNGMIVAAEQGIADHYQVICVSPELKKTPWFADHPSDPSFQQESFLVQSVIPFIDKTFPAKGRYLIGFSKSGFGAFTMLLRHPDLFLKAASWDAPMLFKDLDTRGAKLRSAFGTDKNYAEYFVPDLLKKNRRVFKGRPSRFVVMGHGYLKEDTERLHQIMESLEIPHMYENSKRRAHRWDSGWFPDAVKALFTI